MEDSSIEQIEAGVDRLLSELSKVRIENLQLRQEIMTADSDKKLLKDHLDQLIKMLEQVNPL